MIIDWFSELSEHFPVTRGLPKATHESDVSSIQFIETSYLLFASVLTFILFRDRLSIVGWVGVTLIMVGLRIALKKITGVPTIHVSALMDR